MMQSGIWVRLRSLGLRLERPPKWAIGLSVALVCLLAFGLRCLHLLNDDHYFIVSPDSNYFHRMAELVALDETYFYPTHGRMLPITMFSGITYPLGLLARAIAFATPASSLDALELASKLLPPTLGVATVIAIYVAVSRLYGRSVAILSALAWALVGLGIALQAAGYLDRDCLSILLVTAGVFLFYFLSRAGIRLCNRDFGWMIAAVVALALEVLLYIEWGFVGPAILLAILAAYVIAQVSNTLVNQMMPVLLAEENVSYWPLVILRNTWKPLGVALRESACKSMVVILAFNVAAIALRPGMFRSMYTLLQDVMRGSVSGETTVMELAGMGPSDILGYGLMLIPIAIGTYLCLKRRQQADLLILAWFGILFFAGLFSRRLFIYATPAACIMAGLGFAALFDHRGLALSRLAVQMSLVDPRPLLRPLLGYLRIGCGFLLLLATICISSVGAYSFASTPPVAPDTDWYEALSWLRQRTPEEAVVMTWWDYGYWILDVSHRTPVADNGIHWAWVDADIARVYTTSDDSEAVEIMRRYGATYLVFSRVEMRVFAIIIAGAGVNVSYQSGDPLPPELRDSLYNRSFSDDFQSDLGLERVYPTGHVSEPAVVILALR